MFLTSAKVLQGIVAIHIDDGGVGIACAEFRIVEEHAKLVFAHILAVVNLFRNTVNQIRKRQPTATRYSATVRIWIPYSPSVAL